MVFKVKVTCNRCGCSFELSNKLIGWEYPKCQNCGQDFPEPYFRSINDGIKLLASVPNDIAFKDSYNVDTLQKVSGFEVAVIGETDKIEIINGE